MSTITPTPESRRAFVAQLWVAFDELARRGVLSLGENARELAIAQAGLECGWGESRTFRHALNAWNYIAGTTWNGPTIEGHDLEYPPDGGPPKQIIQHWRVYESLPEAALDWAGLLRQHRFERAWVQLMCANAPQFALELRAAKYFTAPLSQYARDLASVLHRVRAIRRATDFLPAVADARRSPRTTELAA